MSAKSGPPTAISGFPLKSTVSLSSEKNSLTSCIPGDILVNYTIPKKDYDENRFFNFYTNNCKMDQFSAQFMHIYAIKFQISSYVIGLLICKIEV